MPVDGRATGGLRAAVFVLVLMSGTSRPLSAQESQEPQDLASLLDFSQADPVVTRAFQWRYFRAHGYRVAEEVFAENSADWPVARALQASLTRALDAVTGSEEVVTLAGRRKSRLVTVTRDGLTLADRQGEHEVRWTDVTGKELISFLRRRQGKDSTDQVALAVMSSLIGDATNRKRAVRAVEDEQAEPLQTWLDGSAALPAEMAAADALEQAWNESAPDSFVSQVESAWSVAGATQVGQCLVVPFQERFQECSRQVLHGEKALTEALHGDWSATPGENGAQVVEVTYEFTSEAPLQDLRPRPLPRSLRAAFRFLVSWWEAPDEYADWSHVENTLWAGGAHLLFLDLPFHQVEELEVVGIVKADADPAEFLQSFLSFGLYDEESGHYLATYNQWRLMELGDKGTRPSGHKDVQTAAAAPLAARVRWAESMVILERDGETMSRLSQPQVRGGRFFLAAGGHPLWGVQKITARGTVTPATLDQLARELSQARSQALFGRADR